MSSETIVGTDQPAPESPAQDTPRHRSHRRKRWTTIEKEIRALHGPLIAGVDEVGRGPLAGPVVACAVIMPPDMRAIAGVDDSKKLTADQRVRLSAKIRERALDWALGAASVHAIETLNIYQASVLAMRRARVHVGAQRRLHDAGAHRRPRVARHHTPSPPKLLQDQPARFRFRGAADSRGADDRRRRRARLPHFLRRWRIRSSA